MDDNVSDERLDEIERGLIYCYALLSRYRAARASHPNSASDLHVRLTGHRMRFGCCSDDPTLRDPVQALAHPEDSTVS